MRAGLAARQRTAWDVRYKMLCRASTVRPRRRNVLWQQGQGFKAGGSQLPSRAMWGWHV